MRARRPRPGTLGAFALLLSAAMLAVALQPTSSSASASASADEIKAAYLFNFARFVKWPTEAFDDPQSAIVIGIFGSSKFRKVAVRTVVGKRIEGREVEIVDVPSLASAANTHILFVEESNGLSHQQIIASLRGARVFCVSDDSGYAKAGGTANFVSNGSRVRFEINQSAVEGAGLSVSSQLLRVAMVIN